MLRKARNWTAVLCVTALVLGSSAPASRAQETTPSAQAATANLTPDQLNALVAPIALYPDPLLSQTLVASTYPLEVIQLKQWLDQNKDLKDQALADAVQKQDWDPSIQALAALPDVVKLLADNIKWTTDLGNAVLAQEGDVMNAVQSMRQKAQGAGNLKPSDQMNVQTEVIEDKSVIVIESTNPEVVYVPSYNPAYVYGSVGYAYPPIAYPPYPTGGLLLSFGVGVAMGAFWSGGWGYNAGWGGNNINVNNNNNFVRNSNGNQVGGGNRGNGNQVGGGNRGNGNWQHNPSHRGGAPYPNNDLASKYGGNTRGNSAGTRQSRGQGQAGQSGLNRGGGLSGGNPGGGLSGGNPGGGRQGGQRVGNRQVPNSPGATNRGAFSGASSRQTGGAARSSGSRGSSSMRGGGGSRGGSRGGGRGR